MAVLIGASMPLAVMGETAAPSALSETYESWRVACVVPAQPADAPAESPAPARQCEMLQELTQTETGQRVLAVSLRSGADGGAEAVFIAPLGLNLPGGLSLMSGETAILAALFTTCVAGGCVARTGVSADQLGTIAAAGELHVAMTANTGAPLSVALVPAGFAAAWTRLRQLDPVVTAP